ncbi:FAD-dependent oxidoreductase [Leptospira andrefontaineae]|uniref:FAD-dependent oxidoreductase n=1 Tax=Leptospira andrefontaineae TaxID=2484976 RepID=A0A4R9GYE1_9LEPT|nr:FAD-dependent oxidoreductase [Leptospira andrefontaineae]
MLNNLRFDKFEVIIVGAGPVGVLAANLLGMKGISVLLVDKNPEVLEIPRAISLDQDALRILQAVGLSEEAMKNMPLISCVEMISPIGGVLAKINSSGLVNGHPRLVSFYQPDLERLLRKGVERFESVCFLTDCLYLEHSQSDLGLSVKLKYNEVVKEFSASYLLACDGAHSSIRTNQGWSLQGSSYKEDWLIVDIDGFSESMEKVEFFCNPNRPIAHVPGPQGSQRWEFLLRNKETRNEMENPEKIAELMKPWSKALAGNLQRKAVYRFHAKTANCMGKGRVYLLGDAAHLTPPFAGQGLVSGFRDAFNISWKIAAILNKEASPKVLESYDIERRPHAKKMIRLAVFLGSIIMTRSKIAAILRDLLFKILLYSPLKSYLTDMRIKPLNNFNKGLFLKKERFRNTILYPGTTFPQASIKLENGTWDWSDSLLGSSLAIVGYGNDPMLVLNEESKTIWKRLGGVMIYLSDQRIKSVVEDCTCFGEDVTFFFQNIFGKKNRFVIVRPDRIIGAAFEAEQADEVIKKFSNLYV